jgi:hypothetical protein
MAYWTIHHGKEHPIPISASSPVPATLDDAGVLQWQQLHQAAMARMSELAQALDGQDWPVVDQACRWVREVLGPQGAGEERRFFPLLADAGAAGLGEQLSADHREMGGLAQAILQGGQDPSLQGERMRRLLDLVRQHVDTEAHRVLPLLQGLAPGPQAGLSAAGYQGRPAQSYTHPGDLTGAG